MIHFSTYSLDNKCDPPTAYIFFQSGPYIQLSSYILVYTINLGILSNHRQISGKFCAVTIIIVRIRMVVNELQCSHREKEQPIPHHTVLWQQLWHIKG